MGEEAFGIITMEPLSRREIVPRELAFDIDGVVADTFRTFVQKAEELYGFHIAYDSITDYDFWNVMDLDQAAIDHIIQLILDQPIEMGIQPIQGAVEVLTRLSHAGPLLFVTARPERSAITKWVCQQLTTVEQDAIRVEATGTYREKLPILLENGVTYFVEDRLETCYFLEESPVVPIVFEQPWNKKPHPFQRVRTWEEISEMIAWSSSGSVR